MCQPLETTVGRDQAQFDLPDQKLWGRWARVEPTDSNDCFCDGNHVNRAGLEAQLNFHNDEVELVIAFAQRYLAG